MSNNSLLYSDIELEIWETIRIKKYKRYMHNTHRNL